MIEDRSTISSCFQRQIFSMPNPSSESYPSSVEDWDSFEFSAATIQQRQQENEEAEPMSMDDDDSAPQQREDAEDFEQAETPPPQDEVKLQQ